MMIKNIKKEKERKLKEKLGLKSIFKCHFGFAPKRSLLARYKGGKKGNEQ